MKRRSVAAVLAATAAGMTWSDEMNAQTPTSSSAGWLCGSTGGGSPRWTLEADASGMQVLKQSGNAWCKECQGETHSWAPKLAA